MKIISFCPFLLLFGLLTISFSGCKKLLILSYGVKNPKPETYQSLQEFLTSIGINQQNIYVCTDTLNWATINAFAGGIPEIQFYDKNGIMIQYKDSARLDCNAKAGAFIDSLIIHEYHGNIGVKMQELFPGLVNSFDQSPFIFESLPKADYFLILYFTKWSGKRVNVEHLTEWFNKIKLLKTRKINIAYYVVSLDIMDSWGVPYERFHLKYNH
jgi:hypothetical protein